MEGEHFGISRLTEHLVFNNDIFQTYLKFFGGFSESETKDDKTTFYFEINDKRLPLTLFLLRDYLKDVNFSNQTRLHKELHKMRKEFFTDTQSDIWKEFQILKEIGNYKTKFFKGFLRENKNNFIKKNKDYKNNSINSDSRNSTDYSNLNKTKKLNINSDKTSSFNNLSVKNYTKKSNGIFKFTKKSRLSNVENNMFNQFSDFSYNNETNIFKTIKIKQLSTFDIFPYFPKLSDMVEEFFNLYYKTDELVLILKSSKSLDDMADLINVSFGDFKWKKTKIIESSTNNSQSKNKYNFTSNIPVIPMNNLKKFICMQKNKNNYVHSLDIFFPFNNLDFVNDKSYEFINYLLNDVSKNSLINSLKKNNLINHLTAGFMHVHEKLGLYVISIEIGLKEDKKIRDLISCVFKYIKNIGENLKKFPEKFQILLNDLTKIFDINFELNDYLNRNNQSYDLYFSKLYYKIKNNDLEYILSGDYNMSMTTLNKIEDFTNLLNFNNSIIIYGTNENIDLNTTKNFIKENTYKYYEEKILKTKYITGTYDEEKIIEDDGNYHETYRDDITNLTIICPKYDINWIRKKNIYLTEELIYNVTKAKNKTHENISKNLKYTLNPIENDNLLLQNKPYYKTDKPNFKLYYMNDNSLKTNQISLILEIILIKLRGNPIDVTNIYIFNQILKIKIEILLSDAIIAGNKITNELNEK